MKYKNYMQEDQANFAYSDKSIIQKDSTHQQVWVFQHQAKEKKYAPENIQCRASKQQQYISNGLGIFCQQ